MVPALRRTNTASLASRISQKLLYKPVLAPAGYHAEAAVMEEWFKKQGSICPLSGMPLNKNELLMDKKLGVEISHWVDDFRKKRDQREERDRGGEDSEQHATGGERRGDNDDDTNDDEMYAF